MAILDPTPADQDWTRPAAITRSSDHRYTFNGETFPGVTSILKMLDKSEPLMAWAARQTAEAAVAMTIGGETEGTFVPGYLKALIDTVGQEGAVKALTSRSGWKRDTAARLGTAVHSLADDLLNDRPWPNTVDDTARAYASRYADWWQASGWSLRLTEAAVVHPLIGYGGTFDILAKDRDGQTILADIKTGRAVYREAVLQLAAYGMALVVAPLGSQVAYPMPEVDRYVIVHVTAEAVREIEIPIGSLEQGAFVACVELYRWAQSMKGKDL